MQQTTNTPFIEDICSIILEMIGGKSALKLRIISKAWLEASRHLRMCISFTYSGERFFEIVDHVMMEHVDTLILKSPQLHRRNYERMVRINHLKNLKCLHLECEDYVGLFGDMDDDEEEYQLGDHISLVTNSSVFSNLEKLTIVGHRIGDEGLVSLFNSSVLIKLNTLECRDQFSRFGEITSKTEKLKNLTDLKFTYKPLTDEDVEMFCNNQLFKSLKRLSLLGTSSMDILSRIFTSNVLVNLNDLSFSFSRMDKSISKIKSTLKLEKLCLTANTFENCVALINNKTICQSLKTLKVGRINDGSSIEQVVNLGKEIENFSILI